MALSIDWNTKIITVPKADMTLLSAGPPEVRELDIDLFRLELKSIEASEEGMPHLDTHRHNTTVTVGGVTLARVVEIINGYSVTFENGSYVVTLSGANNNVLDVLNLNNVQVRSANSAGLVHTAELEDSTFVGGRVYVNTMSNFAGTAFPTGNLSHPVNNYDDAVAIGGARNFDSFLLENTLVLTASQDLTNQDWLGRNPLHDSIEFNGGGNSSASFTRLHLTGQMSGSQVYVRDCTLESLTGWDGEAHDCILKGVLAVQVDALATSQQTFRDCESGVAGIGRPTLDVNGAPVTLSIRGYTGGLNIAGMTDPSSLASIDVNSGIIEIQPTCTSGTIVIRGVCQVIDTSGAGCNVIVDIVKPSGQIR